MSTNSTSLPPHINSLELKTVRVETDRTKHADMDEIDAAKALNSSESEEGGPFDEALEEFLPFQYDEGVRMNISSSCAIRD
jgi:hypothetical protein